MIENEGSVFQRRTFNKYVARENLKGYLKMKRWIHHTKLSASTSSKSKITEGMKWLEKGAGPRCNLDYTWEVKSIDEDNSTCIIEEAMVNRTTGEESTTLKEFYIRPFQGGDAEVAVSVDSSIDKHYSTASI